ncbi:MAG: hypothetical protein PVG07_11545, partial [Acidobacteriota bacterium]
MPRTVFSTLLLVALPAAPLLPAPWNALAVAVLGGLWLRFGALSPPHRRRNEPGEPVDGDGRPRRPERGVVFGGALLGAAVLVLFGPWAIERGMAVREEAAIATALEERWVALWRELGAEAGSAAAALEEPPGNDAERLRAFDRLEEAVARSRPRFGSSDVRPTLMLVDGDGEAVAWAGAGFLNEPEPPELMAEGYDASASFGSVTLLAVEPIEPGRRPWRVVAGRSFRTDELPFDLPPPVRVRVGSAGIRWSVAQPGTPLAPGAAAIAPEGLPVLVWHPPGEVAEAPWPWEEGERRIAWGLLAALIVGAAVVRGLRIVLPRAEAPPGDGARWSALLAVTGAGAAAAALAGGAPAGSASALFCGFGLLAASLAGGRAPGAGGGDAGTWDRRPRGAVVAAGVAGAAGILGLLALQALLIELLGRTDLAAQMWPGVEGVVLRASSAAAALAVLTTARRLAGRSPAGPNPEGAPERTPEPAPPVPAARRSAWWGWGAFGLLLGAAAAHDLAWAGVALLAAAGGAAAVWAASRDLRPPTTLALLLVLAAGIGASGWETVHRTALKESLGSVYLAGMAPPAEAQRRRLDESLREHFAGSDLAELAPRDPDGLAREDLAFTLWRRSPLARPNALSALLVEPLGGRPSAFAFGPVVATGAGPDPDDWVVVPWEELSLPAWDDTWVAGEATLRYAGVPWAVVRYWMLPRPGFGLGGGDTFDAIELGLLRGRTPTELEVLGLPEPVAYALYTPEGRASVSPWPESPPLPEELPAPRSGARRMVESPEGLAWAWARRGLDGIEVLYLPALGPLRALERVGAHAVGNLLTVAVAAALILLLALPRPAFRSLL